MADLTENALAFQAANKVSSVASARINEDGSGSYTLEDGSEWTLTVEESVALAVPIWNSEQA